ncbi:5-formyltetrahydrofolate cyclo-ligase [Peptoniphilus duerdenii]|uniref:5-formyltetrahydrofolate cyclo-ligase n=1 Tax=Peptoniphilus duerdenii TaxID=507750 RepID=UPI0023F1A316|nr:5-formyltetrahydrofolate cyclo-ligase [Peptoniphilus duerdenii]
MVFEKNNDIQKIKKDLRKKMLSKALALPEVYKSDADARITQLLLGLSEYKLANTIFCFVGVEHEINTRPFLDQVLADGKRLAVPLCVEKAVMEARRIFSLEELKRGYYGLYEPDKSSEIIPMDEVEFAVIPCLIADHKGNRLGHGGGFYDTLFNEYNNVPAAIICRERMCGEVPTEPFDHRFSITVTEDGVFRNNN